MKAIANTTDSAGPMQGVQLRPNTMPSSGEAATPIFGVTLGVHMAGMGMKPANAAPSSRITTPRMSVMIRSLAMSTPPSPPSSAPVSTNMTEKPRMKPTVPISRSRFLAVPWAISLAPMPDA